MINITTKTIHVLNINGHDIVLTSQELNELYVKISTIVSVNENVNEFQLNQNSQNSSELNNFNTDKNLKKLQKASDKWESVYPKYQDEFIESEFDDEY